MMPQVTCVCMVCRSRFFASIVRCCPECGECRCPVCGVHGELPMIGTFLIPQEIAASVRASVWGRGN